MFVTTHKMRVRYAETDRMGYAYYGNYPTYFEVARVEALRTLGIRYVDIESSGVMLPVRDLSLRYRIPLRYDELFTVTTEISSLPEGSRIYFKYQIHNEQAELCTEGETTLVFASTETGRPTSAPLAFLEALAPYF